jgi:hypothetical protein
VRPAVDAPRLLAEVVEDVPEHLALTVRPAELAIVVAGERVKRFRLAAGGPLRIAIDPHGLTLPAPSASPASAEIEGALLDLAREDLLEDLARMRSELEELRAAVRRDGDRARAQSADGCA